MSSAKSRVLIHGTENHDMTALAALTWNIGRAARMCPVAADLERRLCAEPDMAAVIVEHDAVVASDVVVKLRRRFVRNHIVVVLLGRYIAADDHHMMLDAGADECLILASSRLVTAEHLRAGLPVPPLHVSSRGRDVLLEIGKAAVAIGSGRARVAA